MDKFQMEKRDRPEVLAGLTTAMSRLYQSGWLRLSMPKQSVFLATIIGVFAGPY